MTQDIFKGSAGTGGILWTVPVSWSAGALPGANDDAFIRVSASPMAQFGNSVTPGLTATVNSIGTDKNSLLFITGGSSLTATNGTVLSPSTPAAAGSGNNGSIIVDQNSFLKIGNAFDNSGHLFVGDVNTGYVELTGKVAFSGGGTVTLGGGNTGYGVLSGFANRATMVNADNTIKAYGGIINGASIDNKANGFIDVQKGNSSGLIVYTTNGFANEGKVEIETGGKLTLEGAPMVNSGSVNVDSQAQLVLTGDYTVSGSGKISLNGNGARIVDENIASHFTNKSNIIATAIGELGDGSQSITFANSGLVDAKGSGAVLTLNTGANVIDDAGGTLKAENGGTLAIKSDVTLGVKDGHAGVIEADKGSTVIIGASVKSGGSSYDSSGKVVIDGGKVDLLANSSVSVPVTFTKNGGTLDVDTASPVKVSGSNGTIQFGQQGATVSADGKSDAFVFGPATGKSTISGWNSTDSMQLAKSDFANWGSLLQHTKQAGADTIISIDANDSITLKGVAASSLKSSQFHFA